MARALCSAGGRRRAGDSTRCRLVRLARCRRARNGKHFTQSAVPATARCSRPRLPIYPQPGYGLVEAIERGDLDSPGLLKLLERYLTPMLAAGADTLALGCTHYSFLTA